MRCRLRSRTPPPQAAATEVPCRIASRRRERAATTIVVVLLAGASVAAAGPVAFVGPAVPHAVRTVVGLDHRWLVLYVAIYAPVLLLSADVLGRIVMRRVSDVGPLAGVACP